MKKIILALCALAVIALGIALWLHARPQEHPAPQTTTYQNATYGYTLSYPAELQVKEYLPEDVVFGHIEGEVVNGVAEARVLTISGEPGEGVETAAARELANLCAADGPTGSFSCTGIESLAPITTQAGQPGWELYLDGVLTALPSKEKTHVRKGPYYVLPLAISATASRVLVIHPPLNQSAAQADAATIKAIAMSVTIAAPTGNTNPTIEEYVARNLATLSPAKEVLGGTFYVTALEAHGGKGTVSYEDGHNAYTADFTYVITESGVPSVTSFTIR